MIYLRRRIAAFLSLGALTAGLRGARAAPPADRTMSDDKVTDQSMPGFTLSYELGEAGWAHAKLSVGATMHETEVSYLTRDPLGSLAQVLIGFVWPEEGTYFVFGKPGAKTNEERLRTRGFTWEDEPGGWKWTLLPQGATAVKLKVELQSSQPPEDPLVDSIVSLREMAVACTDCIEALLLKHGIVGYRLKWIDGDLPLAQYLLLKRWLHSSKFVPKSAERGTWREDVAALRVLGV